MLPRLPFLFLALLLTLSCPAGCVSDDGLPDLDDVEDPPSPTSRSSAEGQPAVHQAPAGHTPPRANAAREHVPSDFEYDEEEFEGLPPLGTDDGWSATPPPPKAAPEESSVWSAMAQALRRQPARHQEHFRYEAMCGVFIVLYGLNWYLGRRTNEALARRWVEQSLDLFRDQFSHVGTGSEKDQRGIAEPLLVKDSASDFEFYATGRDHCQSCLVSLALRQRHDLSTRLLDLVRRSQDRLIVEVVMNEDCMEPLCLVVARDAPTLEDIRKEHLDVATYTSVPADGRMYGLPAGFQVLIDSPESSLRGHGALIPGFVVNTIGQSGMHFLSLHVSDQLCTTDLQLASLVAGSRTGAEHTAPDPQFFRKALQFVFALPPQEEADHLAALLQMTFLMIDHVATFKLSPDVKQKNTQRRTEVMGQVTPKVPSGQLQKKGKKQSEDRQSDTKVRRRR